jgi:gluconolactonase
MIFTEGILEPEGPVLLNDGSWIVVEMDPKRGCVTHISADGKTKHVIAKTGRPNGLTIDSEGFIWVAESGSPSLLRMSMEGTYDVVLTSCGEEKFLFPNDLVFGPNGALYLTDSGILAEDFAPGGKIHSDYMNLDIDGRVYRIDTKTKNIEKIDSGIRFTNGLVFGPDGHLYVNETVTGMVYRYQMAEDGTLGGREDFGNVIDPEAPADFKGPDGMKFGMDGNLYVTVYGQGDVTVLGTNGEVVNRLKLHGNLPTNCAFGPKGSKKLFVTEVGLNNFEVHDVETDGFPLYYG